MIVRCKSRVFTFAAVVVIVSSGCGGGITASDVEARIVKDANGLVDVKAVCKRADHHFDCLFDSAIAEDDPERSDPIEVAVPIDGDRLGKASVGDLLTDECDDLPLSVCFDRHKF